MRKADLLLLFGYMYWANQRILDAAERLTAEAFVAPTTVTTRDIHATLVHELDVECSSRLNLQGRLSDEEADLEPGNYPDVASLRAHWRRDEGQMRAWLDTLTDEELETDVASGLTADRRPLWHYLMHIFTHAAQQQADAATLLTLAGQSPGDLGLPQYLSGR